MSRAIDQATSEINLLREYRTRLIADVVTGKLDVRGVALPAVEEGLGEGLELGDEDVGEMDGDADEVMEDGEG